MIIRIAKFEDAAPLVEFNQAMALETEGKRLDAQILKSGVEAVFQDENKGFYVVAESGGVICPSSSFTFRAGLFGITSRSTSRLKIIRKVRSS